MRLSNARSRVEISVNSAPTRYRPLVTRVIRATLALAGMTRPDTPTGTFNSRVMIDSGSNRVLV